MIGRRRERNQRIAPSRSAAKPAVADEAASTVRSRRGNGISPFSAWREQHRHSRRSSLLRLRGRPMALLMTVMTLGVALALPLLFWVIVDNAGDLAGSVRDSREMTVFLKTDVDEREASSYADQLRANPAIERIDLRSPAEGLEELRRLSGFGSALDALGGNPLPNVLLVTPRAIASGNAEQARDATLVAQLRGDVRVDQVQYDAEWRRRLGAVLSLGEAALAVLAVVLALAALLIVGNTIRVDVQARVDEINVMQLLGASNGFIRRPFLYAGGWYGLFAGIAAVAIVWAVQLALAPASSQLLASYQHRFDVHGLHPLAALGVVFTSALLGWFGAWIATARHISSGAQPE